MTISSIPPATQTQPIAAATAGQPVAKPHHRSHHAKAADSSAPTSPPPAKPSNTQASAKSLLDLKA